MCQVLWVFADYLNIALNKIYMPWNLHGMSRAMWFVSGSHTPTGLIMFGYGPKAEARFLKIIKLYITVPSVSSKMCTVHWKHIQDSR